MWWDAKPASVFSAQSRSNWRSYSCRQYPARRPLRVSIAERVPSRSTLIRTRTRSPPTQPRYPWVISSLWMIVESESAADGTRTRNRRSISVAIVILSINDKASTRKMLALGRVHVDLDTCPYLGSLKNGCRSTKASRSELFALIYINHRRDYFDQLYRPVAGFL